jgi:aspartate ammonia-lyase
MGHAKGEYDYCHPNNHVNCSQSTNDAYPTAFRIALNNKLVGYRQALGQLADAFAQKGEEFKNVLKMGRTQLQDAVPKSCCASTTRAGSSPKSTWAPPPSAPA